MADDERPAVGSVAEEAARLLDALGGWASSRQAGYAARSAPRDRRHAPDDDRPDGSALTAGDAAGRTAAAPTTPGGRRSPRCESCGAENGVGQAVACQLCPVCQGIGLLRSVRPETVDRLADLAGALAATLRDIAGQRRADPGRAGAASQPVAARTPGSRTSRSTTRTTRGSATS